MDGAAAEGGRWIVADLSFRAELYRTGRGQDAAIGARGSGRGDFERCIVPLVSRHC